MLRRVTLLLCLLALAAPAAALAQSDNPFGPLNLPPVNTTPDAGHHVEHEAATTAA